MKRSEINATIRAADAFIRSHGFVLPPFAYWSPEEFRQRRGEARRILDARMGWDITDYGLGKFKEQGLFLFTVRNGSVADLATGRGMLYAEKIMISRDRQISPMHRHNLKAEDIINRGGGKLIVELFAAAPDGSIDPSAKVTVPTDGIERTVAAGGKLTLSPGESVTLMPGVWHGFWAEGGDVLIGEVSTVNDDETDNVFREPLGRFPKVDEDVAPLHLLVSDYKDKLA